MSAILCSTVESVLEDHPIGHKNMVSQNRWSLVTGSFTLKCVTFCQKLVVLQDRWSLMAVVSQDRFHCTLYMELRRFSWIFNTSQRIKIDILVRTTRGPLTINVEQWICYKLCIVSFCEYRQKIHCLHYKCSWPSAISQNSYKLCFNPCEAINTHTSMHCKQERSKKKKS